MRPLVMMIVLLVSFADLVLSQTPSADSLDTHQALMNLFHGLDQGRNLRLGMRDSTDVSGTFDSLTGSRLLLRTPEPWEGNLQDVRMVFKQHESRKRGVMIGGVLGAGLGVLAGISVVILEGTNPKNKDLAIGGTVFGLLGTAVGGLTGYHLDPGVATDRWDQVFPAPGARSARQWSSP